jgi:hypothetical protein
MPPARVPEAIAEHLNDLSSRAGKQRKRRRHVRQWFEFLNVVIGLPAAVLAGAATVSALKDVRPNLVALLAGGATVLSAAQLFLRSGDRAVFNRTLEAEFGRLEMAAKRACEIDLPMNGEDDARAKLESYEVAFAELMQRAPLQQ